MGSKGSSKQETENKPPAWAAPLFKKSASEASKIYASGKGGNVYQGQTVAGLGANTNSGIQGVRNAVGALPGRTSSATNLRGIATGPGGTSSAANLRDLATGTGVNPYFQDSLTTQLDKTASLINSKFAGSGRYGSGANTSVLGSELGNVATDALSRQYNQDIQNRLAANSQIDSANIANDQTQIAANSQIDAANSNLFQNRLSGNQAVIGAGQLQDANRQAQLTADFTKWQSEDMQPWTRLGLLQSAAAGSAANYGTNTQTQTQPFNGLQAAGALGSLFSKSDARLKENIVPVGVVAGHVVYEWNYRGGDAIYRGVMAQDLLETASDAVVMEPDGFYAVDYARVGFPMERVH